MPLFQKHSNPEAVLLGLLKQLGFPVKPSDVINELSIHPEYNSLLALNDVLNNFGIEAGAYRITEDELADVPCPFITHTHNKGAEFMLVTAMDDRSVTVSHQGGKAQRIKLPEFKAIFAGVVLVPDDKGTVQNGLANPLSFIKDNIPAMLALTLLALISLAAISTYGVGFYEGNWQLPLAALFKTGGLIVAVLLLVQSIDRNNPLVQALCGGGGKTNCNAIISSNAANVFEGLSWSEVGFFYFAGSWLALLFGGGGAAVLQTLAILNIVSLPYTVYSIYYQARVAKQWCVLCCVVQALLWLEFIPLVALLKQPFAVPGINNIISLFICFALPVAVWLLAKPVLLKAQQVNPLKGQLQAFKYNSELFNRLLTDQPKFAIPNEDWSIVLGNVEAGNIITMVTNPFCPPCEKTHNVLNNWLNNHLDIQVRIVFTADNDENDIKTTVARHLMALNELPDKGTVKRALHEWYGQKQKNYHDWAKGYPVNLDATKYYKIEKQKEWCEMAEVKATPTLLINGYRLPKEYQLKDIKYLLA
nr:vitamin K epoxide reductase family protein [uncultured Mucilaginibacter sp.]